MKKWAVLVLLALTICLAVGMSFSVELEGPGNEMGMIDGNTKIAGDDYDPGNAFCMITEESIMVAV